MKSFVFDRCPNRTPQQVRGLGFSLVELAVVLLVIAAVMGGAIAMMSSGLHGTSYTGTKNKLLILQQALTDYRIAYNRLPCPAHSYSYQLVDASFGVAATGDTCASSPAAEINGATVAIGMVPVRTLGLPDDMAFDSWGRRIRYAVFSNYVAANAFDTNAITDTNGLTIINNNTGAAIDVNAVFVLLSQGENGHGGRGSTTGTLVSSGSTNTNELLNCKCDSTGAYSAGPSASSFAYGDEKPDPSNPLNGFDDIAVFSTRPDLRDGQE